MNLLDLLGILGIIVFIFVYPEKWDIWVNAKLDKFARAMREQDREKNPPGVIDIEMIRHNLSR